MGKRVSDRKTKERLKLQEKAKGGSDRSISDTLLLFYFTLAKKS